jgi:ParB family chromosome partitioning protein
MVDSNLQRERILPSEKAFSYKMKLEAIKRTAGRPNKNNVRPVVGNYESADVIGEATGESGRQIQRYVRLTELIPDILELVDRGTIKFRPAVEISYICKENQEILYDVMLANDATPSHAQAIKMKQYEQQGRLNEDIITVVMAEDKPNQVEQIKIPKKRIGHLFPPGTNQNKMVDEIVTALKFYRERSRPKEHDEWERGGR